MHVRCTSLLPPAVELLQRLWLAVYGPQGPAFPGVEHDSWTSLGFQCKRPLSDVRAAKQFGLELLVQVVETEPSLRRLVLASDDEYPFCAAVLDVAFMLFCALKLTPSLPSMCPAIGTKIREPDTADRVDLQGFAGLASTASSPASLMVPCVPPAAPRSCIPPCRAQRVVHSPEIPSPSLQAGCHDGGGDAGCVGAPEADAE